LDKVDWPESTVTNQRNWIGRSEGSFIEFSVADSKEKIDIFTTRPDTIFGATYMVLSPEHPLLKNDRLQVKNRKEVDSYIKKAKARTENDRVKEEKAKTGVELKGIKAVNPATKKEIPVWISDYVFMGYGTGAIMAVPAHDERDLWFAKKFNLDIKQVIAPSVVDTVNPPKSNKREVARKIVHCIVKHPKNNKVISLRWEGQPWRTLIIGGIGGGEDVIKAGEREIREETGYTNVRFVGMLPHKIHSRYYAAHKNENRAAEAQFLMYQLVDEKKVKVSKEELARHKVEWIPIEDIKELSPLSEKEYVQKWLDEGDYAYVGEGTMINSGKFDGMSSEDARASITKYVNGKKETHYRLRDWLISRQRYWGAPIPIVYDPEGNPHPVPEKHLPWFLPTDVEFRPTGTSPLGGSKEFVRRTEKIFGKGWRPEVDTMDTFVCSSWYFFRFTDPHNKKEFASKSALKKWMPVDIYVGGAEHTVLHLMYARFFTKALKKFGYIDFDEPFLKLRHQGTIAGSDGKKMGKRYDNVITPEEVVKEFGADTLRAYEMFMTPFEGGGPWSKEGILGPHRFLGKVWDLIEKFEDSGVEGSESMRHKTIKKVTEDVERLNYNTAVAALMEYVNYLNQNAHTKKDLETLLVLLAPFAPHIAEELWEKLGNEYSIHKQSWPKYNEKHLVDEEVTIVVQVNGKVRATLETNKGALQKRMSKDWLSKTMLSSATLETKKSKRKFL